MIGWLFATVAHATPSSVEIVSAVERTQAMRIHRQANKVPTIPMSTYTQVSLNNVVTGLTDVGADAKVGWGVGIFPVPIEEMYAALNEEVQHVPASPVDVTEIIQGQACQDGRVVFMNLPIPMLSDRWWVTTQGTSQGIRTQSQGHLAELTWDTIPNYTASSLPSHLQRHTIDGVHVQESSGGWLLIKIDDTHTLGEYHSWSNPNGYIPSSIASMLSAQGVERVFESMLQYAQNHTETCRYTW
jgi:hypothetical protein